MTETNLKPEIELESQTSSSAAQVQTEPVVSPEDRPVVIKEYHYKNKNGKDVRVIRKYTILRPKIRWAVNYGEKLTFFPKIFQKTEKKFPKKSKLTLPSFGFQVGT